MAHITVELLEDFAKKFAARCAAVFVKKEDVPSSLPASGGDADTVNGHTVEADVPEGAEFTDTIYMHPDKPGYKHIPAGGAAGQVLRWSASGTAVWGDGSKTEYGSMTGAGAETDGAAGLVPPPAAGDQNAFLRGDGTWQEITAAAEADIDAVIADIFNEE